MSDPHAAAGASELIVAPDERRRPTVVALTSAEPTVEELFAFMREAELRFETLRMRIEERTWNARGEHVTWIDVALRHPGEARVTTSEPHRGVSANYEVWISDGDRVRTYSGLHRLGTERPVRHTVRGLDAHDFPERSRVYWPVTPLPMETLPDTFVHPAGYCRNVLATGRCWISGTDTVAGRETWVLECDHPRTIEMAADRPDFHIRVCVDTADGVILRLEETIAGDVTRDAEVTAYQPNALLAPSTFDFTFPTGTRMLF